MLCKKCNNTGYYMYDEIHSTACPDCCKHAKGYWMLLDHYGVNNGKMCCLAGCGHMVDFNA